MLSEIVLGSFVGLYLLAVVGVLFALICGWWRDRKASKKRPNLRLVKGDKDE